MTAAGPTPKPTATSDLSTSTCRMARRVWATTAVRGALFLLVGLLMSMWPEIAVGLVKWLLVILLVAQTAVLAIEGTQRLGDDESGAAIVRYGLGIVALVAAVALLVWPSSTIKVVLNLVAIWALVSGALGAVGAVRGRRQGKPTWDWELAVSLLSVVFGLTVLIKPLDNLAAVTVGLSVFLTVTGIVLLVAAWSVSTRRKAAPTPPRPPAGVAATARTVSAISRRPRRRSSAAQRPAVADDGSIATVAMPEPSGRRPSHALAAVTRPVPRRIPCATAPNRGDPAGRLHRASRVPRLRSGHPGTPRPGPRVLQHRLGRSRGQRRGRRRAAPDRPGAAALPLRRVLHLPGPSGGRYRSGAGHPARCHGRGRRADLRR